VGDDRGIVRAVDAQSGIAKWEAYTAGAIYQSPAVWEGRVYVGSADGRVMPLKLPRAGDCGPSGLRRRIAGFRFTASCTHLAVAGGVVVADGVLYAAAGIANYDGTTSTPWMHHRKAQVVQRFLRAVSAAQEGASVQGELSLRDATLCFPGGAACRMARYD